MSTDPVPNLNPLRFCYHGQHVRPRSMFRALPGGDRKREVCAECYERIMTERKVKSRQRISVLGKPAATLRGKASKTSGTTTEGPLNRAVAAPKKGRAANAARPAKVAKPVTAKKAAKARKPAKAKKAAKARKAR